MDRSASATASVAATATATHSYMRGIHTGEAARSAASFMDECVAVAVAEAVTVAVTEAVAEADQSIHDQSIHDPSIHPRSIQSTVKVDHAESRSNYTSVDPKY